jgi:hypothetical protein
VSKPANTTAAEMKSQETTESCPFCRPVAGGINEPLPPVSGIGVLITSAIDVSGVAEAGGAVEVGSGVDVEVGDGSMVSVAWLVAVGIGVGDCAGTVASLAITV